MIDAIRLRILLVALSGGVLERQTTRTSNRRRRVAEEFVQRRPPFLRAAHPAVDVLSARPASEPTKLLGIRVG
jgi:hypothetical protein